MYKKNIYICYIKEYKYLQFVKIFLHFFLNNFNFFIYLW